MPASVECCWRPCVGIAALTVSELCEGTGQHSMIKLASLLRVKTIVVMSGLAPARSLPSMPTDRLA